MMGLVDYEIRYARNEDVAAIQRLELDAGRRFLEVGLDSVAEADPTGVDELEAHIDSATAWVAVGAGGDGIQNLVGFAMTSVVDGEGHVDQISVAIEWQGRGVGRALMERSYEWARAQEFAAVTLTTFRDVAWNGPLYAHLGFEVLAPEEIGPQLLAIREAERAAGLDAEPRVAMRLALDPSGSGAQLHSQ